MSHRKRIFAHTIALALILTLAFASSALAESILEAYNDPSVTVGVPTGATAMGAVEQRLPKANIQYITTDSDGYLSVVSGKTDAFAHDTTLLKYACEENPRLRMLEETFGETEIAIGISKKRGDLVEPVNAFIKDTIDSGMRDDMLKRWLTDAENAMPEIASPEAPEITIRVGTSGLSVPMTYYGADGELTGFDLELMARMSLAMNAKLEISVMNYDALVAGLESGKLDLVIANLNITPERAERIEYSQPYMVATTGLVVRREETAPQVESETAMFASLSDMQAYFGSGTRIGAVVGTIFDVFAEKYFPQAEIVYVNSNTDLIAALTAGKIEGYLTDEPQGRAQCIVDDSLWMPDVLVEPDRYGVAFSFGREEIREKMNATIARLSESGELEAMADKWFLADEAQKPMPDIELTGENGTLKLATNGSSYPFSYIRDGELVGYEIEFFERFCEEHGYAYETQLSEFSGIIAALATGKTDAAVASISITEERKEQMLFSESLYEGGVMMVLPASLRKDIASPTAGIDTLADIAAYFGPGTSVGILTGSVYDATAQKLLPDTERLYMNSFPDMIAAVKSGKIEGFLADKPQAFAMCLSDDALWTPDPPLESDQFAAVAVAMGRDELLALVNKTIVGMRDSGELDAMAEKWFLTDEAQKPMPAWSDSGENGTLTLVTDPTQYPFSYMRDGDIVGYDIEIVQRFCKENGYLCEIMTTDFSGVIAAVSSGKADLGAASVIITEERAQSMLFSEPTYECGVVAVLPASAKAPETKPGLDSVEAIKSWLKGKKVALYIGSTMEEDFADMLVESEQIVMNSYADMSAAINAGKIDAFFCEQPIAQIMCKNTQGLYTSGVLVNEENYAFALEKGDSVLLEQLNSTIARLRAEGTLDALREKWTGDDTSAMRMPEIALTGENGVIRVATDAGDAPFGYVVNGQMVGYDYELLLLFAQEHGYSLEYSLISWDALPAAVVSGKFDIACGCLCPTQTRSEEVAFSDITFYTGLTLVVSDAYTPVEPSATGDADEGIVGKLSAAWASVSASFERTFIRENRWKLIAQGLWTTVLISVMAALLGTVLGFGVCMARRSRFKALVALAKVFVQIMQGTPIVVFLMILYYIVFGDVSPVLVAVIGFALNFAAYVSEMMRTGIEAVDKGQIEAASAIGFTKTRTFMLITLPQAARHFLPVFKGEFISLVKMTSVVGYIAIQDLTKMSDIIRSRTYEAFFPLIATAVLYFLLSWALAQGLNAIEVRIDPKRKKRRVKNVKEDAREEGGAI